MSMEAGCEPDSWSCYSVGSDRPPDWMDTRYRGDELERPDHAGQAPPNGYGLRNMGDLVHEWCSDWYDAGYYAVSPERNAAGPASGQRRASRGGSWRHAVKVTRWRPPLGDPARPAVVGLRLPRALGAG